MEGRQSKLSRSLFSNKKNVERMWNNEVNRGSIYGTVLEHNGEKYVITDGDVSKYVHQVFKEVEDLIQEYSKD